MPCNVFIVRISLKSVHFYNTIIILCDTNNKHVLSKANLATTNSWRQQYELNNQNIKNTWWVMWRKMKCSLKSNNVLCKTLHILRRSCLSVWSRPFKVKVNTYIKKLPQRANWYNHVQSKELQLNLMIKNGNIWNFRCHLLQNTQCPIP